MTNSSPTKARFFFIDLLRGWAVIMMIETHAVNAYMDISLRSQNWFWYLNFLNGLVAPTFIFISGFAFRIVTERKWEQYLSITPVFKKQLRRLLFILVLAYSMHLPFVLLKDWTITMPEGIKPFFKVDVLHIISLSLIALQLLVLWLKDQKKVFIASLIFAGGFIFLAPLCWQLDFTQHIGLCIGNYFNNLQGSLFPAFPWAGFCFLGYAVAHFFYSEHKQNQELQFMRRILLISLGTIIFSLALYFQPLQLYPDHNFWTTSPAYFFIRLALVCILLTLMWYYEKNLYHARFSLVGLFGKHSLLVYTMHLAMIFGTFGLPKLSRSNFHHLSFELSFATAIFILIVMLFLTLWWNYPRAERKMQWKFMAVVVVLWGLSAIFWENVVEKLEPINLTASRYIMIIKDFF